MSTTVSIDALRVGDILDSDVIERGGRLILGRGRVLSDKHIETLRAWGITEVRIGRDPVADAASGRADDPALAAARDAVLPRFELNRAAHPLIAVLIEIAAERALAEGGSAGGRL